MANETSKTIAEAPRFRSVQNLMDDVENEIQLLIKGDLSEGKARVVRSMRALQFRGVELFLQAARLDRTLSVEIRKEFKRQSLPVADVEQVKAAEPAAEATGEPE